MASVAETSSAPPVTGARLPKGAILVILFEFFERFGFYSMLSLLALFLTAGRETAGFGWEQAPALGVLGVYTGLMYALPVFGGYVADRVLGHRVAITCGAILMLTGYLLLAALGVVPAFFGPSTADAFAALAAPLGSWTTPAGVGGELGDAYRVVTLCFWGALFSLVLGNALFKSTMVIVLGDSFPPADPRRDRAYAYYYMGINVGGFIAGIAAGSVAANFGWYLAFAMSAAGIGIGLAAYTILARRLLGPPRTEAETVETAAPEEHVLPRLFLLALLAILLCIYAIGHFQVYGTFSLFLEQHVDRHVGSFEIPTQWFTSVNALGLILAAPVFAAIWMRLAREGREPDIVGKYAIALLLGGAGVLLFAWQASDAVANPSWPMLALAILVIAAGEVAAWVSTYGIVYRLAPRRIVAAVMGGFYAVTLGLGGYAAGKFGQLASIVGDAPFFVGLALLMMGSGVIALLARRRLRRFAAAYGADLSAPTA
jgi:POT family proton-dependent oligopeptide transporter